MSSYESPQYKTLKTQGKFEIRAYEPFSTISIITDDFSGKIGFGELFRYIRGNNEKNEKMAMTVPVINTMEDAGMSMEFVHPASHQKTPPKPTADNLRIKDYPAHTVALMRFNGKIKPKRLAKIQMVLSEMIKENGYEIAGAFRLARYNSPFSIPMFRRNELMVEVSKSSS